MATDYQKEKWSSSTDWRGTLYEVYFKVQASAYTSTFSKLDSGSDVTKYVGASSTIYKIHKAYVPPHYYVKIGACSTGYQWDSSYSPNNTSSVEKSYEMVPIYINPKWWNASYATPSMAGWKDGSLTDTPLKAIDGENAVIGSLVYGNATTVSAGSADTSQSPFANLPEDLSAYETYRYVGQTLLALQYTCTFIGSTHFVFQGVNGSFGSGCEPQPSGWTSGTWLAQGSQAKTYTQNGVTKYRITRVMKHAPVLGGVQLTWVTPQGTWSW